jgi:hypothetical protein
MPARPNWRLLLTPVAVALLTAAALADEPAAAPAGRPVPARVVSVLARGQVSPAQPAPAETVPTPAARQGLPALDDPQLIALAIARPQPQDTPADQLVSAEGLLQGPGTTRLWGMSASAWEAPAFCHRPLYFEDENLERHGRSCGIFQPAVSAGHFVGRAAVWPYLAGAFPPHECIYTLGRDRPGSCAPYRLYRPPVSLRGALYEGAAISGLSYVVP